MDDIARAALDFWSAKFVTGSDMEPQLVLFRSKSFAPMSVDPHDFDGPDHVIRFMRESRFEWAVLAMVGHLAFGRPGAVYGKFLADRERLSLVVWLHGPGPYDKLFSRTIAGHQRLDDEVREWDPGTFCVLDPTAVQRVGCPMGGGPYAEA
jgi:hypothetical protein